MSTAFAFPKGFVVFFLASGAGVGEDVVVTLELGFVGRALYAADVSTGFVPNGSIFLGPLFDDVTGVLELELFDDVGRDLVSTGFAFPNGFGFGFDRAGWVLVVFSAGTYLVFTGLAFPNGFGLDTGFAFLTGKEFVDRLGGGFSCKRVYPGGLRSNGRSPEVGRSNAVPPRSTIG